MKKQILLTMIFAVVGIVLFVGYNTLQDNRIAKRLDERIQACHRL